MSDLDSYNAAAANFADTAMAQTGSLVQSSFNMENTKKLAEYQQKLNRQNAEYNRNMKLKSYQDALDAARYAGVSSLAAVGSNPMANAAQKSDSSVTPWTDFHSSSPSFSSSAVLARQLQQMDANINATKTQTAVQQQNLDNNVGLNDAINTKLRTLGYDIPVQNSLGFLNGLSAFDQYLTDTNDRALKRLANDNLRFLENLKNNPEGQKKIQEGFYAELDKVILSKEDAATILAGHKLDNSKKVQDIKVGGVTYRCVQQDLYAKIYDNQVLKPLETARLESEVSKAQTESEFVIFNLDKAKLEFGYEQRSNPWYHFDKRDEYIKNGDYIKAGEEIFLGGLYTLPDLTSTALGIKKLGK